MGMMGGMGGGFRSVPPTGLPETTLKPNQTRHLPTVLVRLSGPGLDDQAVMPSKGERLRIGAVGQATEDPRVQSAMKRLAEEKAPQRIAQLVMWNVAGRLDWEEIARRSQAWANAQERALARQFVDRLDAKRDESAKAAPGVLYWEVTSSGEEAGATAARLRVLLTKSTVLGLRAKAGVPSKPDGPSLACRIALEGDRADVKLAASDADGTAWKALEPLTVKLGDATAAPKPEAGKGQDAPDATTIRAARVADGLAEGFLSRLVVVKLAKGHRVKGHETYIVRIGNASPMILKGLALGGSEEAADAIPAALAGLGLAPHRSISVPATADLVQRLHLKDGIHAVAANLSGL